MTFSGGNVGIGTTSPTAKLDVANATIRALDSATQYAPTSGKGLELFSLSGNGYIFEYDRGTSTFGNLLLYGGNVGIGTTAPSQKLEVAGTIYSTSGGFKFPDGTTQTTAAVAATAFSCTTRLVYTTAMTNTVNCNAGEFVTGGGTDASNMITSYPNGNGWTVTTSSLVWKNTYARCCK
jgi:hypothetical protein